MIPPPFMSIESQPASSGVFEFLTCRTEGFVVRLWKTLDKYPHSGYAVVRHSYSDSGKAHVHFSIYRDFEHCAPDFEPDLNKVAADIKEYIQLYFQFGGITGVSVTEVWIVDKNGTLVEYGKSHEA